MKFLSFILQVVRDLLARYKNLSVDISWIIYDEVICNKLIPKKHWLDIIKKYPDRFMVGSDICGHFKELGRTIARYNNLLELLGGKLAQRVALENAESLYF